LTAAATSAGSTYLPTRLSAKAASRIAGGRLSVSGVRTHPGSTTLTRIRWRATSRNRLCESDQTSLPCRIRGCAELAARTIDGADEHDPPTFAGPHHRNGMAQQEESPS